tara:strand:- start:282 stop:803 length:522 start_codon:yes stop_codon:yes gene_type:complete
MEIETKVIDNYLDRYYLQQLKDAMVWGKMPYQLCKSVSTCSENVSEEFKHWYWYGTLVLYNNNEPASPAFDFVKPLMQKIINDNHGYGFIRVKCNFYPWTKDVCEHQSHTDYEFPHYGAVLSLNTCDGFTRLYDGTKIDSVENRIVFFDASKPHNSSTTSNDSGRFNINLNFR